VSRHRSKQDRDSDSSGAVDQRIAELAELVAAGCKTPVPPSYVREEFEALVDEIRARAEDASPHFVRPSRVRLKGVPEHGADAFEFKSDPRAEDARAEQEVDPAGWSGVASLDEARQVLDAIRSEETSGSGPREDLQRAIA
jgi:hypothetical protein